MPLLLRTSIRAVVSDLVTANRAGAWAIGRFQAVAATSTLVALVCLLCNQKDGAIDRDWGLMTRAAQAVVLLRVAHAVSGLIMMTAEIVIGPKLVSSHLRLRTTRQMALRKCPC